jgi:hypothetical protein
VDYYNGCQLLLNEAAENLLQSDEPLMDRTLIELFESLCFPVVCVQPYTHSSAERTIFIDGSGDENYTSDEIFFMSMAPLMIKLFDFSVSDVDNDRINVFYIELLCQAEEKDLVACALVKLTNKAFSGYNCLLIKCANSFTFGTRIFSESQNKNDFYISQWYDLNDHNIIPFCFDSFEAKTTYETYYGYALTVAENSHLNDDYTNIFYDNVWYKDWEYVRTLHEIAALYNLNLDRATRDYIDFFEETYDKRSRYNDISDELKFVGSNTINSYEMLQMAEEAVNKHSRLEEQTQQMNLFESSFLVEEVKKINGIAETAFEDAEEMLKYFSSEALNHL